MKLQKLCYYSQAWTLVWDNEELFSEDFLRWDNGPICKELFDVHEGMFLVNSSIIDCGNLSKDEFSSEQLRNIDKIIEGYGCYAGQDLAVMVCREAPWLTTPENEVINKDVIRAYYSRLLGQG